MQTQTTARPASRHPDDVLAIASRLAGHGAIGAVHVIFNDRPTYGEFLDLRKLADERNLSLSVTANSVFLRPRTLPDLPQPKHMWSRAFTLAFHRLRIHAAQWSAGSRRMREGNR